MSSYYCHNCQDVKQQNKIELCAEGLICRDCSSDFLEELNDNNFPSLVFEHPQHQQQQQHSASRHLSYQQRHHPYSLAAMPSTAAAASSSSASTADGAVGGSVAAEFAAPSLRVRLGRSGSSGHPHLGHGELDQLIQTLFQQVFGIVGDLDDYVMGLENLDDVVTQLMNQLDGGGPPPATADDLRRIESVTLTESQLSDRLQCSVCFDEFQAGCPTDRLPCQHHFHHDCIQPWLAKHGTCPVCRKSLTGVDTSTQAYTTAAAAAGAGPSSSSSTSAASAAAQRPPLRRSQRRNANTGRRTRDGSSSSSSRGGGNE